MSTDAQILIGDCVERMREMLADSVDAIVTDPPYHLTTGKKGGSGPASVNLESPYGRARVTTGFMGMEWDGGDVAMRPETWAEALRVAKPGAHLLAFGGTRTFHRITCAIEDAGWEIRDCIMWVYGSGFPKSLDVSKAIDKAAGVEREDKFEGSFERHAGPTGNRKCDDCGKWLVSGSPCQCPRPQDEPQTESGKQWQGWGTALKPAWEPIIVARKPLVGTVAENVQLHGTGGINIDGCRIEFASDDDKSHVQEAVWKATKNDTYGKFHDNGEVLSGKDSTPDLGRWPANLIHDGSEEVLERFPQTESGKPAGFKTGGKLNTYGTFAGGIPVTGFGDAGSAARFFYCAKASQQDRDEGLDCAERRGGTEQFDSRWKDGTGEDRRPMRKNHHPTVKPTDLMRYLCRLVTPPGGLILDLFTGSGSTGKAARIEGFRFIGCEMNPDYAAIAEARIAGALRSVSATGAKPKPAPVVQAGQLSLFDRESA